MAQVEQGNWEVEKRASKPNFEAKKGKEIASFLNINVDSFEDSCPSDPRETQTCDTQVTPALMPKRPQKTTPQALDTKWTKPIHLAVEVTRQKFWYHRAEIESEVEVYQAIRLETVV